MIEIDVRNLASAERFLKAFPTKESKKIISRTINRALPAARTAGVKEVRKLYNVKVKDINADTKTYKASSNKLIARLVNRGSSIRLIKFKVKPKIPPVRRPKKLLFAEDKTGEGGTIKNAFVAAARSNGAINVFQRTSKDAYPIIALYGPSAPQMLGNDKVIKAMTDRFQEQFNTRLQHEINQYLGGVTK